MGRGGCALWRPDGSCTACWQILEKKRKKGDASVRHVCGAGRGAVRAAAPASPGAAPRAASEPQANESVVTIVITSDDDDDDDDDEQPPAQRPRHRFDLIEDEDEDEDPATIGGDSPVRPIPRTTRVAADLVPWASEQDDYQAWVLWKEADSKRRDGKLETVKMLATPAQKAAFAALKTARNLISARMPSSADGRYNQHIPRNAMLIQMVAHAATCRDVLERCAGWGPLLARGPYVSELTAELLKATSGARA